MRNEMTVHCNICGETFSIKPTNHLKYNNGGCPNCHKTKLRKCSLCGKEIEVDRRVSINEIVYCEECRKQLKRSKAKAYKKIKKYGIKNLEQKEYIFGSKELNE